jgi:16S rRNA (adenine1518-N6/adenine1519-N6)-dimethyltransferase
MVDGHLNRRDLQQLLEAHGLRPSRALGQNFVVDANTVRRVARLAELQPGQPVLEVGAGLGALSIELARAGAKVTAIEADKRLVPLLRSQVEPAGVRVVQADALTVDWDELIGHAQYDDRLHHEWMMVANLPYNVSVPVVVRVLEEAPQIRAMLVMVQREVGERLASPPGERSYGAVSVKIAYHADACVVGSVPASVFVPRPRVESVLVRIVRRPEVAVDPDLVSSDRLFEVVRAGFAHRRKMLRSALAGIVEPEAYLNAEVDPRSRAEDLSVEQWGRLAA